ncbi:type II toxin-antitoxin system RelE/ParE family toxin [Sedimentitalea sp.]|uniref:type II toxin-antitoxin system RelE/ParE family toxin n=1 Tax=Sedimentitalea sp. TaxID=2048915 RepID=UPI0032978A81
MWELEFSTEAEQDFELIFDHLCRSYVDLGEDSDAALIRAGDRIRGIRASMDKLLSAPFVGTLRPDVRPGLRFVRQEKAVVWFLPDKERTRVVIIAVFFGAQDHIRHMLTRLLEGHVQ